MLSTVLDYLDNSATKYGNKNAYVDENESYTFSQLQSIGKSIGSAILKFGVKKKPIAIFMEKSVRVIASFMGILYASDFYCPIDVDMPDEKIQKVLDILLPSIIITDTKQIDRIRKIYDGQILIYDEIIGSPILDDLLCGARGQMINTDPAYVLFTSGSTGEPKGVLINHAAIIDFTDWMSSKFNITSEDNFGNQSPLHFDLSIGDLYCTLKNGCTNYLIPKICFVFPAKLVQYLNEKRISIIFWVPSALCVVANLKILNKRVPQYLTRILFCGEVMPNKQLNIWRKALPDALYANLYGPCEACDASTYYIVNREFKDDESLPIGIPCENTDIVVLNENDEIVCEDEIGELCIKGIGLALGYYNNPQKTNEVFVQNPVNTRFSERIYRTGDLVKYNSYGELMFVSRKDYQIKHMGHRIELGEIEAALGDINNISECACVYDEHKSKIVLFFTGDVDCEQVRVHLSKKVNDYMMPAVYNQLKKMPHNANGKIDRKSLKEQYIDG